MHGLWLVILLVAGAHWWLLRSLPLHSIPLPERPTTIVQAEWIVPAAAPELAPAAQPEPVAAPEPSPPPAPKPLPPPLPKAQPQRKPTAPPRPATPSIPQGAQALQPLPEHEPEREVSALAGTATPTGEVTVQALDGWDLSAPHDAPSQIADTPAPDATTALAEPDAGTQANTAFDSAAPPTLVVKWPHSVADTTSASPLVPHFLPPPAATLTFKVHGFVKGLEYHASARLIWQPDGNHYRARQEISAFLLGERSQTSTGYLTLHGLQPQRFEDRQRRKLRAATLDWEQGTAHFTPPTSTVAIGAGTQDRLSVFVQLAGLLAAAPERYGPGSEVTVPTASTKAVELWHFVVQHPQGLALPAGRMETLRMERLPRAGHEQTAQVWLAPALGYLPVRIRLSEPNGDYADLQLRSHTTP